jgi:porin
MKWMIFLLAGLGVLRAAPTAAQDAAPTGGGTLDLRADWTQFLSAAAAGEGDSAPRYGGRVDGYAKVDGAKLGLWDGLTINAQAEFVYGSNENRIGSMLLLPVNAALTQPVKSGERFDLSVNIVQKLGKFRIQAGKINLLDASSAIPIVGGGGKEGFQNTGLAVPPGLLAYPKIVRVIATAPVGRFVLNLGHGHRTTGPGPISTNPSSRTGSAQWYPRCCRRGSADCADIMR